MFEGLLQPMHLVVILGIALLVFGPRRLPELGKGLGEAIRGFKNSIDGREAPPATPATREEDALGTRSLRESPDPPHQSPKRLETI
jgi:sec-independent protein translocase protein TatA